LIIVDASSEPLTQRVCEELAGELIFSIRYAKAEVCGAAAQRAQGLVATREPVIWFLDDDIELEPECVARLHSALGSDNRMGGVNAMIVNQKYHVPGRLSQFVYSLMAGKREASWAGRVIGPAINFLPDDRNDLPEVVPVEWLNTTCTMYRRESLPSPLFPSQFTGYSLMEDLALSQEVGKSWKLANARTARIFHDSQPGSHKNDAAEIAAMSVANRHYVMTKVMGKCRWGDLLRFWSYEAFLSAAAIRSPAGLRGLISSTRGRVRGLWHSVKPKRAGVE
jgi:glycosyltransferase involved in cell wall biosynthesis